MPCHCWMCIPLSHSHNELNHTLTGILAAVLFQTQMLGMHGTVTANYAVNEADLLLAFGARFDDRVTGA